jgi:Transposase, Mutator family
VMEAYLHGVSTRKVDDLVKALGADSGISKSEVSGICADLDEEVSAFRDRSLADVEFPYVFLDATYCKARVNRRVVSQAVVIATGVRADGWREVLGFAVGDSEDGAFWTAFLRSLKVRRAARRRMAEMSGAFPAERPGPGPQRQLGDGGCGDPHDLRPTRRCARPRATRGHRRDARPAIGQGRNHAA